MQRLLDACFGGCKCASFPQCCCCSPCCPGKAKGGRDNSNKDSRHHIQYKSLELLHRQTHISSPKESSETKVFHFPQPSTDTTFHPLFVTSTKDSTSVTKKQPQRRERRGIPQQLSTESLSRSPDLSISRRLSSTAERSLTLPSDTRAWSHSINQEHLDMDPLEEDEVYELPAITVDQVPDSDCSNEPSLHFSLYYNIQQRDLCVNLISGSNLPKKDRLGLSDPFVCMYLDPNREELFESTIKHQTLNPRYNEIFTFKRLMPDELSFQKLVFRVYDYDKYSRNDYIGAIVLPLRNANLLGTPMVLKLDESSQVAKVTNYL